MAHTFNQEWAVRLVGSPAVWANAYVYTDWVAIAGHRRVVFLVGNAELDGDMALAVYEATSAAGAGAQALTGLSDSFVDGTDEDRAGIFEVRDIDLSDGFTHVGLLVYPGATDGFCAFALLGESYERPVSNLTTDGVAFVTGE
jgi:hypothetical protein